MGNPTTRVLALLELLQTHGLISGTALASMLEVDQRTLRRYIQVLGSLGIPVLAQRGRDGGYCLMPGFKLGPMMFTNDEALALALGLTAARSLGLSTAAPAGAAALSKLERMMPEHLRRPMRAVSQTVTLDIARGSASGDPAVLGTLSLATQNQQRVHLAYLSAQQMTTQRDVDPYGLAYLGGRWYLVAYCHLRQDTRSFRLDRIRDAALLPASFGRPAGFDQIAYMNGALATLPRTHTVRVLLHTALGNAHAAIAPTLGLLQEVGSGVMLHSQTDDLEWMAHELARLPFRFAIEEPAALGEALKRHAAALLACAGPSA